MAGESIVGALRVVLGMDTAAFEAGAKRAASSANSFGTQLAAVFSGVGLARIVERTFDAIAHSFKKGITDAFEFADNMGKMAQKVGISVEELTSLKVAADLSDVSMEALSAGLGRLSKSMVEASQGSREARDQFKALGIEVKDSSGNLKSTIQILTEMADKFSTTDNGAAKVTAAMKLLGRGGKELIPLLNEGGDSLKEFAKVAEDMGLVVSRDTANQVQKFNDDLKIVSFTMQGIANLVVKDLISGLVRMSSSMADTAKRGEFVRSAATQITTVFKDLIFQFIFTAEAVRTVGETFALVFESIQIGAKEIATAISDNVIQPVVNFASKFTVLAQEIIKGFKSIKEAAEPTAEEFGGIGDAAVKSIHPANAKLLEAINHLKSLEGLSERVKKLMEAMFEKSTTDAKRFNDTIDPAKISPFQQEMNKLSLQARILAGDFSNLPKGLPELAAKLGLVDESGKNLGNTFSQLPPQLQQLGERLLEVQARQLVFDEMTPFQKYTEALRQLEMLRPIFEKLGLDVELLNQKMEQEAVKLQKVWLDAGASIAGSMGDIVSTFAGENKKMIAVAKALHAAQALIAAYAAAAETLANPALVFPANVAAAASVLAKGLAFVAAISAVGFQTGGSFKVGGGVGGVDTKMISFMATPGEMVDIRRPGQTQEPSTVTVNIQGDKISRDQVRELFDTLNEGMADGYRLKLGTT